MENGKCGIAHRLRRWLTAAAVVAVVCVAVAVYIRCSGDHLAVTTDGDGAIDASPAMVQSLRAIGQWEFLTVSDEELVDTTRRGFFTDDTLVRIYHGTLRLGLDFAQADTSWVAVQGDSVVLRLPPCELLDTAFVDEARTESFYESGTWTAADHAALTRRAADAMRRRCLTPDNVARANRAAERAVRQFLQAVRKR